MAENKTKETEASVQSYFETITNPARRTDCQALTRLMTKATKQPPKMWGSSIVGFGSYHYRYDSGREGDAPVVGFSSRKSDITIYGLGAGRLEEAVKSKLGKHETGKGCFYVRELGDIDLAVLERLVANAYREKNSLEKSPA